MTKKTTNDSSKPVHTIRIGSVKATIWANTTDNGSFYSTTISRTYKNDDGSFGDSNSFSTTELLAAAHVAQKATDAILDLNGDDK